MAGLFDTKNVAEEMDFKPYPAGDYKVLISTFENKTSAAGNKGLNVQFTMTEGEFKGRLQFNWMNAFTEGQSGDIARRQLMTMAECVGIDLDKDIKTEKDYRKFLNKKLIVIISFDDSQERFKNSVTGYKSLGGKPAESDDIDEEDIPF